MAELANLRIGDCHTDMQNPTVHVRYGKGGVPGDVIIAEDLRGHLCHYMLLRRSFSHDMASDASLLTAASGKPYTRSALQKRFKAIVGAIGLPRSVSLKCLRHTFCREILRATCDLRTVQAHARLGRLASTVKYADVRDGTTGKMLFPKLIPAWRGCPLTA